MTDTCVKHSFEIAAGVCKQCHNSYCSECLVYAFGPKKPPYCVQCALNVAGVRHNGAAPNPRIRKKGLFGRKVLVDEEPRKEKGFDDIDIELPAEAFTAPVMSQPTRRAVSPEVLAMVQGAGPATVGTGGELDTGGVALDEVPGDPEGSLSDWAASLDAGDAAASAEREAPSRPASTDAWPEDSIGRSY